MAKTTTVAKAGASTTVDTSGAVDAEVVVGGVTGDVTLVPSEHGQLSTWGNLDNWASDNLVQLLSEMDAKDRDEAIEAIVAAVQAAPLAPARYEVHAIADADCTRVRDEVLWQGGSLEHARARASHAGGVYGAAVVDTETGAIDFGV